MPLVLALFLTCPAGMAQTQMLQIQTGLEIAPPLITDYGGGLLVDVLRSLEAPLGVRFNIRIMPFSRAKHELQTGGLQFIGVTSFRAEGEDFYNKANELDWSINAAVDMYTLAERNLDIAQLRHAGVIGTPYGNEDAMARMVNIHKSRFYAGHLKNLIEMLKARRIDGLVFERASTMSTINKLEIEGIRYQKLVDVPGSMALQKNAALDKLKPQLEAALKAASQQGQLKAFTEFHAMPDTGIVTRPPLLPRSGK